MALKLQRFKTNEQARKAIREGGDGAYALQNIPAKGCTIRFLTEPEGWIGFKEFYDDGVWGIVSDEMPLPDGVKASRRYVANVLWIGGDGPKEGSVQALKMPKSVADKLMARFDKYGSITNRDFSIEKEGEGLKTSYDVVPEDPTKRALGKYDLFDLEEKLNEEHDRLLAQMNGDGDDEDEKPARKGKAAAKSKKEEPEDDDESIDYEALGEAADEEDEEAMEALAEAAADAGLDPDDYESWADLAEALTNSESSDDEDEEEADDEDEEEEAQVSIADLRKLAKKADKDDEESQEIIAEAAAGFEIDPDDHDTWAAVVDAIEEAASSDDDSDDSDDDADDEEDDFEELDLEELKAMSLAELKKTAERFDIDLGAAKTKAQMVKAIVAFAEE